ncbi:hypothetical protein D2C84_07860 [Helicobacter pylori]|nr:hypothetical protein D2C86_07840 [Helicobacter pylori]QEF26079.1 hypothetical protein D2C84_07860 [Helicobacter pylori]
MVVFFGSFSSNASLIFSFIFSFFIVSSSFIFFLIPFSFVIFTIFFLRNHSYTQKKTQQTQK